MSGMMLGTTFLITVVMLMVWDAPVTAALAAFIVFGFVDGVYFTANLNKVSSLWLIASPCWAQKLVSCNMQQMA